MKEWKEYNDGNFKYIERTNAKKIFLDHFDTWQNINDVGIKRRGTRPFLRTLGCSGSGKTFTLHRSATEYFKEAIELKKNRVQFRRKLSSIAAENNECNTNSKSNSNSNSNSNNNSMNVKDNDYKLDGLRFAVQCSHVCAMDCNSLGVVPAFCWRILASFVLKENFSEFQSVEEVINHVFKYIADWRGINRLITLIPIIYGHKGICSRFPVLIVVDGIMCLETKLSDSYTMQPLVGEFGRFLDNYPLHTPEVVILVSSLDGTVFLPRMATDRTANTMSVASFPTKIMMNHLNDTFGVAVLTRLIKNFTFYLEYLVGQTNGIATQYGALKKLFQNKTLFTKEITAMINDRDRDSAAQNLFGTLSFQWLMDKANESFESSFNSQLINMETLLMVHDAVLLPFQVEHGNLHDLRFLNLNAMITVHERFKRTDSFSNSLITKICRNTTKNFQKQSSISNVVR